MKIKIANVKGMIAKSVMLALAAGALTLASPAKADAQGFVLGVRVGNPYYAPGDRYDYARRQEIIRHDEWVRIHRFDRPYRYR